MVAGSLFPPLPPPPLPFFSFPLLRFIHCFFEILFFLFFLSSSILVFSFPSLPSLTFPITPLYLHLFPSPKFVPSVLFLSQSSSLPSSTFSSLLLLTSSSTTPPQFSEVDSRLLEMEMEVEKIGLYVLHPSLPIRLPPYLSIPS